MVSIFALLALIPAFVSAANITVTVGVDANGQSAKMILPNTITAQPGDVVNFQFMKGNHTITQSPFSAPCTRQKNTVTGDLGIDTSFQFVSSDSIVVPLLIDSTAPIWYLFCGQAQHCNDGMVAVINVPAAADKTFELFKAAAAKAPIPGPGSTADFTPATGTSSSSGPKPTSAASAVSVVKLATFASSLLVVSGLLM